MLNSVSAYSNYTKYADNHQSPKQVETNRSTGKDSYNRNTSGAKVELSRQALEKSVEKLADTISETQKYTKVASRVIAENLLKSKISLYA